MVHGCVMLGGGGGSAMQRFAYLQGQPAALHAVHCVHSWWQMLNLQFALGCQAGSHAACLCTAASSCIVKHSCSMQCAANDASEWKHSMHIRCHHIMYTAFPENEAQCRYRKVWLTRDDYIMHTSTHHLHR
jgi:hypothetical protein